jgi:outer membrane biosynthesis protein TonB
MASKLNNNAVLAYAESFAKAVCSDFFAKHERITGSQLTDFCGIKQINLFIIKILFENWQADNAKIKSPFFDYENPEIKALLEKLMNMLSRNISIDQATFEKLVTQSVADTIQLLLAPYVFYEQEIQKLAQNGNMIRINEEFKPALKYVKTHKILFDQIVRGLEEKSDAGMVSVTKATEIIGTIVDNNVEYDDPKTVLRQLGDIVPLKIQEFVTFTDQAQKAEKVEEKAPESTLNLEENPQKEDVKSFFDTSFEEEDTEKRPQFAPSEVTYAEKKEEPKKEEPKKEESKKEEPKKEEPKVAKVEEQPTKEEAPLFKSYKREEVAEENNTYSSPHFMGEDKKNGSPILTTNAAPKQAKAIKEPTTFADKYTTGADADAPTFAERFKPSGKTIKELITLNQKFLFTKKLFGNNQDELEDALTGIDRCATHKEAIMFLKNNYIMKYDWDFQHDDVKEFWELVELRF